MVKKMFIGLSALFFPLFGFCQNQDSSAQQVINPVEFCQDPYLNNEMVQFNDGFLDQGFKIDLFQIVPFRKKAFVPVRVHLNQGVMYQVNFVANRYFENASIALVDKDKKEIYKDKFKGKTSQQHWFSRSLVAPYTGDYWVVMSQTAKGRDIVCGGLSILSVITQ